MILAGKGRLAAIFVKKLHFLKDMKVSYFTPEQQKSLNKEWFEDQPAKIYLKKGKPPEVLDGRHRSLYFVLIGKPDYMVPVEFYTDD